MEGSETRTDGNAIAGVLQEVFVSEVTTGRIACAGCGKAEPIGAEHAYTQAPGIVLRCRHCEDVLLVVTQPPGDAFSPFPDLGGSRSLRGLRRSRCAKGMHQGEGQLHRWSR